MAGPLFGLKVIEMCGLGPVPLAGQLMADQGANVIVIDRLRSKADPSDINRRNKRSIVLDLKSDNGLKRAQKLIDSADILLEGFRPGVMERLGLGPEVFEVSNRGLIYGRMTGWGQSGPLSSTAGHDINYLSISGALHAIGNSDTPPVPPLNLLADYGGGAMFLLFGVMSALYERHHSGCGQIIDAAMVDGVPAMMGLIQQMYSRGEWQQKRESNMLDGGAPYYCCYETRDGKYVSVGAIEPPFFKLFLELAGLPDSDINLQNDQRYWPEMRRRYATHFKRRTRSEWELIFSGSDACVTPVLNFDEAADYSHNRQRGTFISPEGVLQTSVVPRFSRSQPGAMHVSLGAGDSTNDIVNELEMGGDNGF